MKHMVTRFFYCLEITKKKDEKVRGWDEYWCLVIGISAIVVEKWVHDTVPFISLFSTHTHCISD